MDREFPESEIIEYCKSKYPEEESCGIVIVKNGRFKFIPCSNAVTSKKDETFAIHPLDYAKASDEGVIYCIVHSHVKCDATFSYWDQEFQKKQGTPWFLVGLLDGNVTTAWLKHEKEEQPLFGRKYVWQIYDCYSFIRDYYKQKYEIDLPDFYRDFEFWKTGKELYLDNFEAAGFTEVHMESLQEGDVILLQLGSDVTSHGGVYVGGNRIAHHVNGRLSSVDIYGTFYQDRTTRIVRHKEMMK